MGGHFVLGLDLDGVCADYWERMREIAAVWFDKPIEDMTREVSYDMYEWGLPEGDREAFKRLHRFAVVEHGLFETVKVVKDARPALQRLSDAGVRVRIITSRFVVPYLHETTVTQTVRWLDKHAIPYWDLCFMRDKELVAADVYIEDSISNVEKLRASLGDVIVFTNSTNKHVDDEHRADNWTTVERMVGERFETWRSTNGNADVTPLAV